MVAAAVGGEEGTHNASGTSSPADVTLTHRADKDEEDAQLVPKIRAEESERTEEREETPLAVEGVGGKHDSGARREPG